MKVIIGGGGTGGHIFPAIAVADTIKDKYPSAEILFVGAKGRMEMDRVPKAGYPIEGLPVSGLYRKLTWRNVSFVFRLLISLWQARSIIRRFKPDVVIGFGGYASGPTLEMAVRLGIPTVIHEGNSFPGITNRMLGKRVRKVCVAYPDMDRYFPPEKIVLTGNPVRRSILVASEKLRREAVAFFELDQNKRTLLVFGGSLGARTLNEALAAHTQLIAGHTDVQIIWQVGKLYEATYRGSGTEKLSHVRMLQFVDRMDLAYMVADLVVCRAGALTLSELSVVAKPAVLVPSPNVAEDHQTKNAMRLAESGAADIVTDKDARELLMQRVYELVYDDRRLRELSDNIRQFAKREAAGEIVIAMENVLK